MSLVFAGICSHAPGITGRANIADPAPQSCVSRRKTKRLRDAYAFSAASFSCIGHADSSGGPLIPRY